MAKKTRAKTAAPPVAVPQSAAEADDWIRAIGLCQGQLQLIQVRQDAELAEIKRRMAADAAPFQDEIKEKTEGLRIWAEANRQALTGGKTKTVRFCAGTISWRTRPASVSLRGKVDDIIERIRAAGLTRLLRQKTEVDKEAMLADPGVAVLIDGVSIGSAGEDFVVEPATDEIAALPAAEVA